MHVPAIQTGKIGAKPSTDANKMKAFQKQIKQIWFMGRIDLNEC